MNSRERILAAIHHQPLDRVPTDIWATPADRATGVLFYFLLSGRWGMLPGSLGAEKREMAANRLVRPTCGSKGRPCGVLCLTPRAGFS